MKRYTVKELSALSGVSARTLDYDDEIELLEAWPRRSHKRSKPTRCATCSAP